MVMEVCNGESRYCNNVLASEYINSIISEGIHRNTWVASIINFPMTVDTA